MVHKFIRIKSSRNEKSILPYLGTETSIEKSMGEIQGLLMKFGCEDVVSRTTQSQVLPEKIPCVLYTIGFIHRGKKFVVEFPIIIMLGGRNQDEPRLHMNASGRIILNWIRALLTQVEIGVIGFDQAMMPMLLVKGRDGKIAPLADVIESHMDTLQQGIGIDSVLLLGK